MFETTFPDCAADNRQIAPDMQDRAGDTLRAFDWLELVARIAATNDLRLVVNDSRQFGGFASFHAGSAEHETGKQRSNLDGLGAVKHADGKGDGTNHVASDGDRED